jgi:hypothetical protein
MTGDWRLKIDGLRSEGLANGFSRQAAIASHQSAIGQSALNQSAIGNRQSVNRHSAIGNRKWVS